MAKYGLQKTEYITRRIETLQHGADETLKKVLAVIHEKVEFYDVCFKSWDKAHGKYSAEEIELGRKCCEAGLNMADAITNELRIIFTK